jgi:hypothetical protein
MQLHVKGGPVASWDARFESYHPAKRCYFAGFPSFDSFSQLLDWRTIDG